MTDALRPSAAFPIGLIALDLDGTLIDEDLVLGARTIAAIAAARGRGIPVSIVTGRMTSSALPYARELGLVDPLVAYQGALVRALPPPASDPRLGRILALLLATPGDAQGGAPARSDRTMKATLQMKRLDLAAWQKAYDGGIDE